MHPSGSCRVLPGAAGCCRVLLGAAGLPGCRVAGSSCQAPALAVLGPMLLPWHHTSDTPWYTPGRSYSRTAWIVFQQSYFVFVCAWCLQLSMLGMLFSEISDSHECAPTGDVYYLLKLVYISVYTGYILIHVIETVSMFEWIQHAPNAMEVSTIELSTIELQLRRTVKRSSRQARPRPLPPRERRSLWWRCVSLSLSLCHGRSVEA